MQVKLKNGVAVVKDICPLRAVREYEKVILDSMNEEGKVTDFAGVNKAQFELTQKMVESITLDGKEPIESAKLTEDWMLDNLDANDYEKIEDAVGTLSGKWETKDEREKKRKHAKTDK